MLCIYFWFIWQCISCFRWHEKPGISNVKWKHFFLDFGPTLDEEWLVENYIYHSYSCFDSSALWTLHFTMYYEFCNPKVDVFLPNWRFGESGCYISLWMMLILWVKSIKSGEWRRKQTEQALSWKQDSILGRPVIFELYAQYLWKRHTNWKTRPPGWKSPRAGT